MNPYDAYPRPASPGEVYGYSGSAKEVKNEAGEQVLKWAALNTQPQGFQGLASVQISQSDVTIVGAEDPNSMLVIDVSWQSGIGGGEATGIDATKGAFFTISGISAINVNARLISSVLDEPLAVWATKRVEATVTWDTSISPKAAMVTLPSILLQAGVSSAFFPIPQQAMSVIALTRFPAALPTLEMSFSTDPAPDGIKYSTINPNANGTPIVHGVGFVQFLSPVQMVVFPTFELWL